MTTIIDRYLITSFLRGFLILLAVGVGLYILADLLVNLDEFTENRALSGTQVLSAMLDYYGHNLPLYIAQLGGPVMAFAGAYTVALLLRNNELTPMVAAGVPLQRLVTPLTLTAMLIIVLLMVNREFVLPSFSHQIARQHEDLVGSRKGGVPFAMDDHHVILTARRIDLPSRRLEQVIMVEPPERGGEAIEADAAVYDPAAAVWRLERGSRLIITGPQGRDPESIRREPVSSYPFGLTPEQLVLRQSSEWVNLLSLRQMNTLLASENLPNLTAIRMQRHIWLTTPLVQLLLLLLTIPFFLTREPANVLTAGGRSLVVTGAFFAVSFASQGIISGQWAALVVWAPILLFGPVAVLLLANLKT